MGSVTGSGSGRMRPSPAQVVATWALACRGFTAATTATRTPAFSHGGRPVQASTRRNCAT
jgi:hypothetical protein